MLQPLCHKTFSSFGSSQPCKKHLDVSFLPNSSYFIPVILFFKLYVWNLTWPHLKIQTCIFYLSTRILAIQPVSFYYQGLLFTLFFTYNDGVPVLAEIFTANTKSLIQTKTKGYNYMACIPRILDIFKHKRQKLA